MKRRRKRRISAKRGRRWVFILAFAASVAVLAVWLMPGDRREHGPPRQVPPARDNGQKASDRGQAGPLHTVAGRSGGNRVAILIDDIGYDAAALKRLLAINAPLAFSVLPHLPLSGPSAEMIHRAGKEVLLHLPMEPHGYPERDPGKGALFASMTAREIRETLDAALASVPHAEGVNNHMGSRFMEDRESLGAVFDELRRRGLFFIDSVTSDASAARGLASEKRLRFAPRDRFIDDAEGPGRARATLEALLAATDTWDELLIIGHPYPETVRALEEMVPRCRSKGIGIVPPSAMAGGKK